MKKEILSDEALKYWHFEAFFERCSSLYATLAFFLLLSLSFFPSTRCQRILRLMRSPILRAPSKKTSSSNTDNTAKQSQERFGDLGSAGFRGFMNPKAKGVSNIFLIEAEGRELLTALQAVSRLEIHELGLAPQKRGKMIQAGGFGACNAWRSYMWGSWANRTPTPPFMFLSTSLANVSCGIRQASPMAWWRHSLPAAGAPHDTVSLSMLVEIVGKCPSNVSASASLPLDGPSG